MNQAFGIVAIGASRGGYLALQNIISALPESFPMPICIVQHIGRHESWLPQLLQSVSQLPVGYAINREPLVAGRVYVAPPDQHLVVRDSRLGLSNRPRENYTRPAIDPLFCTAAVAYHEKTIGLVLTGELADGTVGLQAIKACGGVAMVQDPGEAEAASMPKSALRNVDVDYCLPLERIPETLLGLANNPPRSPGYAPEWVFIEAQMNLAEEGSTEALDRIRHPLRLSCPECREAIWFAIRALHEKRRLLDRLALFARETKRNHAAREYETAAAQAVRHAAVLQEMVTARQGCRDHSTKKDYPA